MNYMPTVFYKCHLKQSYENVTTTFTLTLDNNESPMDRYVNRAMTSLDRDSHRRFLLLVKGIAFCIDVAADPKYNLRSKIENKASNEQS